MSVPKPVGGTALSMSLADADQRTEKSTFVYEMCNVQAKKKKTYARRALTHFLTESRGALGENRASAET